MRIPRLRCRVLFLRRCNWETFCNFWHFSRVFFFFAHGGKSFLFCIDLCWWRCGAPKQFMSVSPRKEVGGEKVGQDLIYCIIFSFLLAKCKYNAIIHLFFKNMYNIYS